MIFSRKNSHCLVALLAMLASTIEQSSVNATIYYSGDKFAELPAQWKGFLADHRQLRLAGSPPSTKLLP